MCCDSAASPYSVVEAGAPAEIEITPAMIRAGTSRVPEATISRFEDVEDVVPRVYMAMRKG